MNKFSTPLLAVIASIAAIVPIVHAQDRVIEEIIVTGERREQNIHDVSSGLGVITNEPQWGVFEASVRVDAADFDRAGTRTRLDDMVNLPLTDDLALRAVVYKRDEPGWVKTST